TPEDILLKKELDDMATKNPNFSVTYKVDRPDASWNGAVGYFSAADVDTLLPPPCDSSLVLVCGPPPMMKAISGDKLPDKSQGPVEGLLAAKGYSPDMVYKF
ncbi:unnamed protein product, partial [Chrysoparadoxa australica]